MPLIDTHTEGVRAKISAVTTPVEAEVNSTVNGVKSGVSARLIPTTQYVPLRIGRYEDFPSNRIDGSLYVDDGANSYKISLQRIKDMNTKILCVDNVEEADFNKLSVGDFIYENIKENI